MLKLTCSRISDKACDKVFCPKKLPPLPLSAMVVAQNTLNPRLKTVVHGSGRMILSYLQNLGDLTDKMPRAPRGSSVQWVVGRMIFFG